MARRRTRKEKIIARLRRGTEVIRTNQTVSEPAEKRETKPIVMSHSGEGFFAPEISLSTKMVASDLTKSVVVTILALILQFALSVYLAKGGWQSINGMLHGILAIY